MSFLSVHSSYRRCRLYYRCGRYRIQIQPILYLNSQSPQQKDNLVLKGYSDFDFGSLPTLDILEEIHNHLGYRLSLDNIAKATLNAEKTADGLQALRWWKQGKIREIMDYCKVDVEITRDIYLFGQMNGYLLFTNKAKNRVRVPVDW